MSKFSFEKDVLPVVRTAARKRFAGHPDREMLTHDAVSTAWEFLMAAPETATPNSLARYAVRRVATGRQFAESARSIDGPNPRQLERPARSVVDPATFCQPGDDPAEIAGLRIDFADFTQNRLTDRQRAMVAALAEGGRTGEVAAEFQCTPGNVSHFRRSVAESWQDFRS